ncbi:hypothetical protein ACT3SP_03545 [Brachybacterium sp. AOP43-C2-M15]|uniref:hypothetical protein n=1 Tax=Brachybacterium sp. AOP43-C2-M15 TaxID=3457661 RepID=UPI004033F246
MIPLHRLPRAVRTGDVLLPAALESEALEDGVLELPSDVDPMMLAPGRREGTPADEYRPGARSIAEILRADGAITPARLDGVWDQRSDRSLTPLLGEERIAAPAAALSALTSPQSAR